MGKILKTFGSVCVTAWSYRVSLLKNAFKSVRLNCQVAKSSFFSCHFQGCAVFLRLGITFPGLAFGGYYCSSRNTTPNVLLKILNKISGSKKNSRQRPKYLLAAITRLCPLTATPRVSGWRCYLATFRLSVCFIIFFVFGKWKQYCGSEAIKC